MSYEIQRNYIDKAMFPAEPIKVRTPQVTLLWMTPDPLGAIAAACRMYEGKPTYNLRDISDDSRRYYWEQARSTHLKAPLEFVKFHFFIEGVDRSLTHQMVRQRTAVYAQESMRFAVKDHLRTETSIPPSLAGTVEWDEEKTFDPDRPDKNKRQAMRDAWEQCLISIQDTYNWLIAEGMPAEDARGLLPHSTLTRLNYCTDLRALMEHAGNRLCTQAQFHWRLLFLEIMKAIKGYNDPGMALSGRPEQYRWQYEEIASIFRPVCYQHGSCPFKADFDRGCTIRERADRGAFDEIDIREWMADPTAAFVKDDDASK